MPRPYNIRVKTCPGLIAGCSAFLQCCHHFFLLSWFCQYDTYKMLCCFCSVCSLVIQWRFVNRVQKQMNAFLEVFTSLPLTSGALLCLTTRGQNSIHFGKITYFNLISVAFVLGQYHIVNSFNRQILYNINIWQSYKNECVFNSKGNMIFVSVYLHVIWICVWWPILSFSQGFTELIIIDLIKIFDENELEVSTSTRCIAFLHILRRCSEDQS